MPFNCSDGISPCFYYHSLEWLQNHSIKNKCEKNGKSTVGDRWATHRSSWNTTKEELLQPSAGHNRHHRYFQYYSTWIQLPNRKITSKHWTRGLCSPIYKISSQQGQGNYGSWWSTAAVQTENTDLAAKLCLWRSFSNAESWHFPRWNMDTNEKVWLRGRNKDVLDIDGIKSEFLPRWWFAWYKVIL